MFSGYVRKLSVLVRAFSQYLGTYDLVKLFDNFLDNLGNIICQVVNLSCDLYQLKYYSLKLYARIHYFVFTAGAL
jgi:hypothetical protein